MGNLISLGLDTTTSVDLSPFFTSVKDVIFSNIATVLPIGAVIFAALYGIKMAPRMIKWFTRG